MPVSQQQLLRDVACSMELPPYLDRAAKSFSDPEPRTREGNWEDWGNPEEDIDWEDVSFPAHHTESYYERRRRAW